MAKYVRDKRSPVPKSETVSKIMSSIKGVNTKPELKLRHLLFANGVRGYRVNYKKLPGKPDIVFTRQKVAIFINGCFWHGCEKCGRRIPKHNFEYWNNKIQKNISRDAFKVAALEELGYTVLTFWEHDFKTGMNEIYQQIIHKLKLS